VSALDSAEGATMPVPQGIPPSGPARLAGPLFWLALLMLCATVSALALGLYDVYVRQPRTPRLAVVDIARLFAAAERSAKESVLTPAVPDTGAAPVAELMAAAKTAENFGPSVERVLGEISAECQCAIVAMAAVMGRSATVPDYTQEAARRLGLMQRAGLSDRTVQGR